MKNYQMFLLGMIVAGAIFALGATIGVKTYSVMSLTTADVSNVYPGTGNFLVNAGITVSGTGSATPGTAGLLQTLTSEKTTWSKNNGSTTMVLSASSMTSTTSGSQATLVSTFLNFGTGGGADTGVYSAGNLAIANGANTRILMDGGPGSGITLQTSSLDPYIVMSSYNYGSRSLHAGNIIQGWAEANSSGVVITTYRITSNSHVGTGVYDYNLSDGCQTAAGILLCSIEGATAGFCTGSWQSTSVVRISTWNTSAAPANLYHSFMVICNVTNQ